jgi:hypothetical protein
MTDQSHHAVYASTAGHRRSAEASAWMARHNPRTHDSVAYAYVTHH